MMRKKRSRKVQTLRLRQHSDSSNLGADIKLPGEEQEAQAELNKPEEEDANNSGPKDDALEKSKSEASELDSALAKRRQKHKALASRRHSNSSELDSAVCVDANNSVPNDDAMEMMRNKRSRKVQNLCLRQHSNSSNLGADIKLPGEEQAELNKPEEEDADINNKKTHVEDEEEVGNREIHVNVTGGIAVNVVGAKPSEVEENRKKK